MEKKCQGCTEVYPLSQFYRHSQMTDGHLNYCRTCVRNRVADYRERNIDAVRAYDRRRGRTERKIRIVKEYMRSHPEIVRRGQEAWALRNPHKVRASQAVNNAVRDGRLLKSPCEVCGNPEVHGHHDDYSKPLKVRWLCDRHHKEHHNRMRELQRAAEEFS